LGTVERPQEQGNRLKSLSAAKMPPLPFQLASVD